MATLVAPAERGATRIADRVVAKIAAQAAREALPAVPADRARPHATVAVLSRSIDTARPDGTPVAAARVRISLELDYPVDIGAQCAAVRRQVIERVRELAGMAVPEVTVQVERLHSEHERDAERRRTR
ncbi:Asp23/Gls24 family envelope stress response protein [Streptomyces sp. NPDC046821]|uniref:Asp23/Gls24 family envelope stress response protein n=1 Tax=Streptomyces sp. NPDC046821 TaxID=3154702 RepID=UPI0033D72F96